MTSQLTRSAAEFGVLGPLVARIDGRDVEFTGRKERILLAHLLLHPNETLSLERLIDTLWPDDPPATARNTLQAHVSRLRKSLGAGRLVTAPNGYGLLVEAGELDLFRFRSLVAGGRRARAEGDAEAAAEQIATALDLWRGRPLPELSCNPAFRAEIDRLDEERLAALEDRIDSDLELGEGACLVAELETAVVDNPLRERLMGQLMVALYRAGRQVQALETFGDARRRLVDELGLEPGPLLSDLHRQILAHDPSLIPAAPVIRRLRAAPTRRSVTVVLASVPVATDVDPEVGERAFAEAQDQARAVFEEYRAVVSTSGDTIVGTFGLPAAREDDPHRAVRAAAQLSAEGLRVALDTGVVLASETTLVDSRFVGHVMKLLDAAVVGVIVGEGARAVLGDAVDVNDSVLVSFDPTAEPIARHYDAPLVGRDRELERLRDSFLWAVTTSTTHLVTVVGAAGIGKSRLARELSASVSPEATVLTGRCLAHGSGALWPLAEMVKQFAGDTTPEALDDSLGELEDRRLVLDQLAAALGTAPGMNAEDAFWAFRKMFGALAAERPLVLIFEDLHWAEGRLLDFIEQLAERGEGSPILVLCLARPDLLEQRPAWGGGKLDTESIQLARLSEESSHELIRILGESVPEDARGKIAARAEGNPLFIEQLVALAAEDPGASPEAIPASIHAVLAARIDRVALEERAVLERASIIGLEFSLSGVAALAGQAGSDEDVSGIARRLVEKDLLRPVGPEIHGADDYRFRHILIRDVVYGSVLKATRAELHERFARWLEQDLQDRATEVEEIIGYHLERSYEYRRELEPDAEGLDELANEAGERFAAAGRRQLDRADIPAAIDSLERARHLLAPENPRRGDALAALASVYQLTGGWCQARRYLEEAFGAAAREGDSALAAYVRVNELQLRLQTDETFSTHDFVRSAVAVLSSLRGESSWYAARVKTSLAWAYALSGQYQASERLIDEVVATQLHTGDPRKLLPSVWLDGPLGASEVISRCEGLLGSKPSPRTVASCYRALAVLRAMQGKFEAARELTLENRRILQELGLAVLDAGSAYVEATVELLAGDLRSAEQILRAGVAELELLGETMHAATLAALLARAVLEQGCDDEVEAILASAHKTSALEVSSGVTFRAVLAQLLARRGFQRRAKLFGREAVAMADETESPDLQASARSALAQVFIACAHDAEAQAELDRAVALYEQKGNLVEAARTRALLSS